MRAPIPRLLVVAFLAASAGAEDIVSNAPVETMVFAIEYQGDRIFVGAEVGGGLYPTNDMLTIYEQSGRTWQAKSANKPEMVCLWDTIYNLQQDRARQAKLHLSAQWVAKLPNDPNRARSLDLPARLSQMLFDSKFLIGPYTLILTRDFSQPAGHTTRLPTPMRQVDGQYRVAKNEYLLSSIPNYICTLAPPIDPRGRSRPVRREALSRLPRFEVLASAPGEDEATAQFQVVWRPPAKGKPDPQPDPSEGRVFLYCDITSEPRSGYGERIADLQVDTMGSASAVRILNDLLRASRNAKTVEDQQRVWHSRYAGRIGQRAGRVRAGGFSEEEAARRAAAEPVRIAIHPEARLLASIDCRIGLVHFLVNPDDDPDSFGTVVDVAQVLENGRPVLADSFAAAAAHGGLIYQVLASREFKAGLLNYLHGTHSKVIEAIMQSRGH
jgi:hypothetical protein